MWNGASRPGSFHENEDRWGTRGTWAWVVDGATNPLPSAGTAAAHAEALSAAINASIGRNPWVSPTTVLEHALGDQVLQATAGQSATVALADRRGDVLRWLVLGDCTITWTTAGSLRSVTDDRLARVAVEERAAFTAAPIEQRANLRRTLVLAEQTWRNRSGGFWVATNDPTAARQALTGVSRNVETVLLTTDGAHAPDNADDLRRLGAPQDSLDDVHTGEDDATAVLSTVPRIGDWAR